ncbi:MAG TPA: ParB/RepB/Spo0J family partition protein [Terriglobia bacterium]|nr:ParB/RepB/Spo0J family partition protein [Terriglobia bacterium]
MKRKALGRGISALIREVETMPPVGVAQASSEPAGDRDPLGGEESPRRPATVAPAAAASAGGLHQIPIALIEPNPFQPRHRFPEESLQELADSIRSTGLLQPVLLRPAADRYQLVAGERRAHAARLAGLSAIPALVRPLSDQEALELALTENLLREDLNAMEVAQAYQALTDQFGLTHEQIAERLGLSRTTVTNTLRLLRLPEAVRDMVAQGALSEGHARALLNVDSEAAQLRLAQVARTQGLSVRQVEERARAEKTPAPKRPRATALDANVRAAARELERTLGTRVRISGNGKRGKIEISYFSVEDLNRIYELIAGKSQ